MAVIKVDLSNVGENNIVPEGEHQAVVYDAALRDNKAGDGQYINWQFKIIAGPSEGSTVFHMTSLKQKALFKLREMLVAIGYPLPADGSLDLDTEDCLAKKCTIVVTHEEYEGKKRAKIADILPAKEVTGEDDPFAGGGEEY